MRGKGGEDEERIKKKKENSPLSRGGRRQAVAVAAPFLLPQWFHFILLFFVLFYFLAPFWLFWLNNTRARSLFCLKTEAQTAARWISWTQHPAAASLSDLNPQRRVMRPVVDKESNQANLK